MSKSRYYNGNNDIKKEFKGNLGMFLACAKLCSYNLIAMPISRNTKGYDIVVLNPETNRALAIQVKCTDKGDFPIFSSHWKDYETKMESKILSDFVFVDISDVGRPNYFIVSGNGMKDILLSGIRHYAHESQQKNNLNWEQMLEREEIEKRKPHLWAIKLRDIEEYKDKWDTITNRLQRLAD